MTSELSGGGGKLRVSPPKSIGTLPAGDPERKGGSRPCGPWPLTVVAAYSSAVALRLLLGYYIGSGLIVSECYGGVVRDNFDLHIAQ
eukprot:1777728-Amphidinium_carterae.1